MSYKTPVINQVEMPLEIKKLASQVTSCVGGHCVRTRYGEDQ